jgi:hypothetical protein
LYQLRTRWPEAVFFQDRIQDRSIKLFNQPESSQDAQDETCLMQPNALQLLRKRNRQCNINVRFNPTRRPQQRITFRNQSGHQARTPISGTIGDESFHGARQFKRCAGF